MLSSVIASYKVSKLADDEFASDTDPDHDWGRKEKATSNVPPIWNSASPPNRDFLADWTGGGNAGAMTAATSAIVPDAAFGGSGYAAPTAAPFANNGAAQDWNAVTKNGGAQDEKSALAPQIKVLKTHGGSTWTGKSNWDGEQTQATEYWKDDDKAEDDKSGGGDKGGSQW